MAVIVYLWTCYVLNTIYCDSDSYIEDNLIVFNKEVIKNNEGESLKDKDVLHITSNVNEK